jgi:hypothetical protein
LSEGDVQSLVENALKTALKLAVAHLVKNQQSLTNCLADPKVKAMWDKLVASNPQRKPPEVVPAKPQPGALAPLPSASNSQQ